MLRPPQTGRYCIATDSDLATFRPQLTSLIDVMTFLLVFLIKSFSVQGDVITPSTDLQLPFSSMNTPPTPAISIEITKTGIFADGRILSPFTSADNKDGLLIPAVFNWMTRLASRASDTTRSHEVLIQADREIEYAVLKRVMYSCSKAGYADFTILALQKE